MRIASIIPRTDVAGLEFGAIESFVFSDLGFDDFIERRLGVSGGKCDRGLHEERMGIAVRFVHINSRGMVRHGWISFPK